MQRRDIQAQNSLRRGQLPGVQCGIFEGHGLYLVYIYGHYISPSQSMPPFHYVTSQVMPAVTLGSVKES